MNNLGRVTVDLIDLSIVTLNAIDDVDNLTPSLIQFLQTRSFFNQLRPKFLMQFGRVYHRFLAKRNMIIEPNNFDKITLLLLAFFQFLFDDLLESIDNKLLDKRR